MPSVTICTDKQFAPSGQSHPAQFGQFWYILEDDDGQRHGFGFGPDDAHTGALTAPGDFTHHGLARPLVAAQQHRFALSPGQFDAMLAFSRAPTAAYFNSYYNVLSNNSLDFVAAALRRAHIDVGVPLPANSGGIGTQGTTADTPIQSNGSFARIAIDLDDDGLETTAFDARPAIITTVDARLQTVGWLEPDDGWLVWDRDGNGRIDIVTETFAQPESGAQDERPSPSRPPGLTFADNNRNEMIDVNDAMFAPLRIWRDRNRDGVSQADELATLADCGIISINLAKRSPQRTLANGNISTCTYEVTRRDGTVIRAHLATMMAHQFRLHETVAYPLSRQAKALPNLRGAGWQVDLGYAITTSPALGQLVERYLASSSRREQWALLTDILQEWSSAPSSPGATRDDFIREVVIKGEEDSEFPDKKALALHKKIAGKIGGFSWKTDPWWGWSIRMQRDQLASVHLAFNGIRADLDRALAPASRLAPYVRLFWEGRPGPDGFAALEAAFDTAIARNLDEGMAELIDFIGSTGHARLAAMGWQGMAFLQSRMQLVVAAMRDGNAFDSLATTFCTILTQKYYSAAALPLEGVRICLIEQSTTAQPVSEKVPETTKSGEILISHAHNSQLIGGVGDDILEGLSSLTYLDGRHGNDIYRYGGNCTSIIRKTANEDDLDDGHDTIQLTGDITAESVRLSRDKDKLRLTIDQRGGALEVHGQYDTAHHADPIIDEIRLPDGRRLSADRVDSLIAAMAGFVTDGSDMSSLPPDRQEAFTAMLAAHWI